MEGGMGKTGRYSLCYFRTPTDVWWISDSSAINSCKHFFIIEINISAKQLIKKKFERAVMHCAQSTFWGFWGGLISSSGANVKSPLPIVAHDDVNEKPSCPELFCLILPGSRSAHGKIFLLNFLAEIDWLARFRIGRAKPDFSKSGHAMGSTA